MHYTLQFEFEITEKYMNNMFSGSRGLILHFFCCPKNFNPVAEFYVIRRTFLQHGLIALRICKMPNSGETSDKPKMQKQKYKKNAKPTQVTPKRNHKIKTTINPPVQFFSIPPCLPTVPPSRTWPHHLKNALRISAHLIFPTSMALKNPEGAARPTCLSWKTSWHVCARSSRPSWTTRKPRSHFDGGGRKYRRTKNPRTPVAYFVSFLSLLEQSVVEDSVADAGVAAAAAYFWLGAPVHASAPLWNRNSAPFWPSWRLSWPAQTQRRRLCARPSARWKACCWPRDHQQWSSSGNVSPKRALVECWGCPWS